MGRDSYSNRRTVESCNKFKANDLKGIFNYKTTEFHLFNFTRASYKYKYQEDTNSIRIFIRTSKDNSLKYYDIGLIRQSCNYGNDRYYFSCPACHNKTYTLYLPYNENVLACRKCHNLTYYDQKNHKKSADMWKSFHYLRKIDKLKENKTLMATAKGRRKLDSLYNKLIACAKYSSMLESYTSKLKSKVERFSKIT